jgi:hypothetical protein
MYPASTPQVLVIPTPLHQVEKRTPTTRTSIRNGKRRARLSMHHSRCQLSHCMSIHERIDPLSIMEGVCRRPEQGFDNPGDLFFGMEPENPHLREAIEFYRHPHSWSNRLVAGDSLLVTNSLLEKEGMAGKVQMIYINPPYGIK